MYHGFNLSNGSKGETFPISLASSTVKSGSKKNSVLFTTKLKRTAFGVKEHAPGTRPPKILLVS